MNPEERKDVFEDVIFSLAKKEKEQERNIPTPNILNEANMPRERSGMRGSIS